MSALLYPKGIKPPVVARSPNESEAPELWRGCVFAAPFHEGAGDIHDASPYHITGQRVNDPSWRVGLRGPEMEFASASDQYINLGNPAQLQITEDLSVFVEYNRRSGTESQLLAKDSDTAGRGFTLDIAAGDTRFYINGGGGGNLVNRPTAAAGTWQTVVGTYQKASGVLTLYLDGVEVGFSTGTTAGINNTTGNVLIARREYAGFTEPFDGFIRSAIIWRRALSASEVARINADPDAMFRRRRVRVLSVAAAGGSITGTGAVTLGALTASGTGTVAVAGTGSPSLPSLTASGSGAVAVSGTGTGTLPSLTGSGTSTSTATGTGSPSLPVLTASGSGTVTITGTGSPSLPSLTGTGSGTVTIVGTGSVTLPLLIATGSGAVVVSGSGTGTLPALTGSGQQTAAVAPYTCTITLTTRTPSLTLTTRTPSLTITDA